ncbi:MAG TPA: hypothetical protein VF211_15200 [Burkholderiales bacterium]
MQPADIAVELRPRSAWEAMDLGLAMLQRWWRAVLAPHAVVLGAVTLAAWALAEWLQRPGLALLLVWWLKPLYDRVVLHVLSRAVFGEVQGVRKVLAAPREWLGSGLFVYLLLRLWPDLARSFALPVRQLEGSRGREARERLALLGRRTRGSAVWLTIVCMHFEAVLYWSLLTVTTLLAPAKAYEARNFLEVLAGAGAAPGGQVIAYMLTVLVVEPFYVAGGFALYLNRRTLLEGWDLEVALRRLAERHAALAAAVLVALGALFPPAPAHAQKDPRTEIAEVLKAPEFGYERETMVWQPRDQRAPDEREPRRPFAFAGELARIAELLMWIAAVAVVAFLILQLYRALPRLAPEPRAPYRAPEAMFGLELAPETLPEDVPAAAAALAGQGRLREALALLYRGALSRLVHQRGVQLLASHTEAEVLGLAPPECAPYLARLIEAWRACAYASRAPAADAVQALAREYATL